jgi:hypothetical protein
MAAWGDQFVSRRLKMTLGCVRRQKFVPDKIALDKESVDAMELTTNQ